MSFLETIKNKIKPNPKPNPSPKPPKIEMAALRARKHDIKTKDGSVKSLADLNVGDELETVDMVTGAKKHNQVTAVQIGFQEPAHLLINGQFPLHREQSVVKADGEVTHARRLRKGDRLATDKGTLFIEKIQRVHEKYPLVKLEVDGDHTFVMNGLILHNASRFWVGGTGTWDASDTSHWSATTGGGSGASVPGVADDVTFDGSSGGGTCTPNTNMSIASLTMGAFTGTIDFSTNNNSPTIAGILSVTGTGTRTLKMGSGTWTMTTTGAVSPISGATTTNLTLNPGTSIFKLTGNTANQRTLAITGASFALYDVQVTAGTGTISVTAGFQCHTLDFTGSTGSLSINAITLTGNLIYAAGQTSTASTNAITFAATSGTQTITTNGVTINKPITVNAPGATVQLAGNLTMATDKLLTHTAGTFDMNSKTVSIGQFASNSGSTRVFSNTGNGGSFTITGNAATVWAHTSVGLTLSGTIPTIGFSYSGATGTRTISGTTGSILFSANITAGTDIVALSNDWQDVDFNGFGGTISNQTRGFYGSFNFRTGMTHSAGANVTSFKATSGTKTITSNAAGTLDFPITINAVGGTIQLADNLTLGTTRKLTVTAGTFDLNGKACSVGQFDSSGSTTRTLTDAAGGATFTVTGNNATVWTTATTTNLTITSFPTVTFNYASNVGTRTITGGSGSASAACFSANITAGTDIVSLSNNWNAVDLNGFTGTFGNATRGFYNSFNFRAGITYSAGASVTSFINTSGTLTITSNGQTLDFPITCNNAGTVQLADALTLGTTRLLTLTAGTLDFNGKAVSVGGFSSSGSTARTLTDALGGATFTLTGNNMTIWTTNNATNLTLTSVPTVVCNYNGAVGTRTVNSPATAYAEANSVSMTINNGGTDIFSQNGSVINLDFTGFAGSIAAGNREVYGNITIPVGVTVSASATTTTMRPSSGTKTLNVDVTFDTNLTIISTNNATVQLADNLTLGSTRRLTVDTGVFDINGKAFSTGYLSSSSSNNVRTMTDGAGGGTCTVTGNNLTSITDFTFNAGLTLTNFPTIVANYNGAVGTRRFSGGFSSQTGATKLPSITVNNGGTDSIEFQYGWNNIDHTGFAGTVTNAVTPQFIGNVTLEGAATYTSGSNVWTYIGTSGTAVLTTDAATVQFGITVNGAGGTLQLGDALTMSANTLTLTAGTLDLNGKATSVGGFTSTANNTRVLTFGATSLKMAGTNTTFWLSNEGTLTINVNTGNIDFNNAGAGTKAIQGNSGYTLAVPVKISAGTGQFYPFGGMAITDLDCTGFAGNINMDGAGQNFIVRGNVILAAGMTILGNLGSFWALKLSPTSGTKTITSNGLSIGDKVEIDAAGATVQFADAFTIRPERRLTLTAGTLDINGKAVSVGAFYSSNSNTRVLTDALGGGTIAVTGNNTTIFDISTDTGLTFTSIPHINASYNGAVGTRSLYGGTSGGINPNFDITAGTDSVDFGGYIAAIDFTGFTGAWSQGSTCNLLGNLVLDAAMTTSNNGGTTTFSATSGTKTITSNGVTINFDILIDCTGATIKPADALVIGTTSALRLANGTFDTNNINISMGRFYAEAGTKVLTLGSSIITLTDSNGNNPWVATDNATGLTINAGTSTIKMNTSSGTWMYMGAFTYYDIEWLATRSCGNVGISGSGSAAFNCHNLTFVSTATSTILDLDAYGFVASGALTMSSVDAAHRAYLRGDHNTNPRTPVSAGSVSLTDVLFKDIDANGAAIPWTGTRLGDIGNNLDITFTAPSTKYWVGDSGNVSDSTNHWATVSGGAPSVANFPLPQDNALFDANSFTIAAQTVTFDADFYCGNFDWSAATNNPAFDTDNGWTIYVKGDASFAAGVTNTTAGFSGEMDFIGAVVHNLTSNGIVFNMWNVTIDDVGGSLVLQDDFTGSTKSYIAPYDGTFDANNKNVTVGHVDLTDWYNAITVNMGSGVWTVTGDDDWDWNWHAHDDNGVNVTLNCGTSEIVMPGNTAFSRTFIPGNFIYNKLTYNQTDVGSSLIMLKHNSATIDPGHEIGTFKVTAGVGAPALVSWDDEEDNVGMDDKLIWNILTSDWNGIDGTDNIVFSSLNVSANGIWFLRVTTPSASYVAVEKSHATYGSAIDDTTGGVNNGDNTYWLFIPPVDLTETVTIVDTNDTRKFFLITASEVITLVDTFSRNISLVYDEVITIAATYSNEIGRALSETITIVEQDVVRTVGKVLTETVEIVDTFNKGLFKVLTEVITLVVSAPTFYKRPRGFLMGRKKDTGTKVGVKI